MKLTLIMDVNISANQHQHNPSVVPQHLRYWRPFKFVQHEQLVLQRAVFAKEATLTDGTNEPLRRFNEKISQWLVKFLGAGRSHSTIANLGTRINNVSNGNHLNYNTSML